MLDLERLVDFLGDLDNFDFKKDDKAQALIKLLKTDVDLKHEKVIIFTEFMSTAKYLEKTLKEYEFEDLLEIDSSFKGDRGEVIKRFAPFYNKTSTKQLKEKGLKEIRILIATDVLSEGINLQDARLLINYDLHWNPVRLMQRIGRVDRRMDFKTEALIKAEYPKFASKRGVARYWNFLPPDELNEILSLYNKVTSKTLRISKVFGIEGKQLLTEEDDYEALKDFEQAYEGETSKGEEIKLKYQKIIFENPSIEEKLNSFPLKVFSGKETLTPNTKGVFFCYRLPIIQRVANDSYCWSLEEGITSWYFYDLESKETIDDFIKINQIIACDRAEKRIVKFDKESLIEIRKTIEKRIKNSYYKDNQVPMQDEEGNSLNPILLTWMEVN
jgi:superfamily II DNA/RNA helicase